MTIALNHMVAPGLSHVAFFDLAASLGITQVEIRNDLAGVAIEDGTPAAAVRQAATDRRLRILSINALQRFNHWTAERASEARALAGYARDCGAAALVLCPVNDRTWAPPQDQRLAGLVEALAALKPILAEARIVGLIEPLGFPECSLRLKSEAVAAIDMVAGADRFRLVHDTFHHHVAGEGRLFPERTGLVHVSGVTDPQATPATLRDPHRGLIDARDRIGNLDQLRALRRAGLTAPISFEPFAAEVHTSADIADDLKRTIEFLIQGLADQPAA